MRGGSEKSNNAIRLANALADTERAYQAGLISESKIKALAEILHYEPSQLLDDMHDLYEYIGDLRRKCEE